MNSQTNIFFNNFNNAYNIDCSLVGDQNSFESNYYVVYQMWLMIDNARDTCK